MHNLEIVNGKVSFAENVNNAKRQIAWHGLGQRVEGAMCVADAIKACNADYNVSMEPVAVLPPHIMQMVDNGEMIDGTLLRSLLIENTQATIRTDTNTPLGVVSDRYGIVQNVDAFKFVDLLCSGQMSDTNTTPTIETCGVLGKGERVFVTAKFPEPIVLNSKRDDLLDMYVVFTTSHDGKGAVRCIYTPIRVVCNNTLNLALRNNLGRVSFRHSSNVMQRIDLLQKENREFAYKSLHLYDVYANGLKAQFEHLENIKVSERDLENILAEISLSDASLKEFKDTRNIFSDEIPTKGRNIYLGLREAVENGIGQEIQNAGSGMWLLNGITTYYQNNANERTDKTIKFDSLSEGTIYKKVNKAHELILECA